MDMINYIIRKGKKSSEKKPIIEEKKPYLDPEACQHPGSRFDIAKVLRKPDSIDDREWYATQTISLFHNINLLYGTVSEFCTAETCPLMQGPMQMQYTWVEERGKKLKCTAPQYIDYVMTFCQKCVSNQDLFPTKYAQSFSDSFMNEIKKMLRYLFNVLSHLYYAHFFRIRQLDLHGYLNIVFKHFTYFVREYNLIDRRDTASLDDLVDVMGMYSPAANSDDIHLDAGDSPRFSTTPTKSKPTPHNRQSPNPQMSAARGNGPASSKVSTLQSSTAST